jgi:hypothetical protein
MNTNKAAYWIALGVLALGLNSEYQRGNFATLHQVADRAEATFCSVSARAEQTLAAAVGLTNGRRIPSEDLFLVADRAEMARTQAEMLREQAREQAEQLREQVRDEIQARVYVLRAQADMRRAEIEQLRSRVRTDFSVVRSGNRRVAVVCPKQRIVVSDLPQLDDQSVDVRVVETF